jgi:hypothetical protein
LVYRLINTVPASQLAAFDLSTTGRFSGVHRGRGSLEELTVQTDAEEMAPTLKVRWREVDWLENGHGVAVYYHSGEEETVELACVVGFKWLHGGSEAEVEVLRAGHPDWAAVRVGREAALVELRLLITPLFSHPKVAHT